jgi:hypothetical protein
MAEHLQEVRLAAPEEAAHPRSVLSRTIELRHVAAQDALEGVTVLPIADEGFEFGAQFCHRSGIGGRRDPGLPAIGQGAGPGVAVENLVDFHAGSPIPWSVMPCAR